MGNGFAQFAILVWPIVVIVLFQRMPVPKAIVVSLVAGYFLLPGSTGFNLPALPRYDKDFAAAMPALIMAIVLTRGAAHRDLYQPVAALSHVQTGWLPQATLPKVCLLILLIGPFVTTMLNGETLIYGTKRLTGLGLYDACSATLTAMTNLLPFILARKYLGHPRDHGTLLVVLCLAGLAYSLPTLWEWRMSPQLNRMIYGFAPDWQMSMRGGGFRPSVFMGHGLRLAIIMAVCALAALACFRVQEAATRARFLVAAVWLFIALFLCRSLGAMLIAMAIAPLILFCTVRLQLIAAGLLAVLVLLYPMARSADLVPTQTIINVVEGISSEQRVNSLNFRFLNEDILLEKANEKPLFGWGGWGRQFIYDEAGNKVSISDGAWVIVFGEGGWIRYIGQFGLLTLPIILLTLRRRQYDVNLATSGLCLVLVANLIDLIPNSGMSPIVWLMAGALAGRLEVDTVHETDREEVATVRSLRYGRPSNEGSTGYAREATRYSRFDRPSEADR